MTYIYNRNAYREIINNYYSNSKYKEKMDSLLSGYKDNGINVDVLEIQNISVSKYTDGNYFISAIINDQIITAELDDSGEMKLYASNVDALKIIYDNGQIIKKELEKCLDSYQQTIVIEKDRG